MISHFPLLLKKIEIHSFLIPYLIVVSLMSCDDPDEALLYFVLTILPVWRRG